MGIVTDDLRLMDSIRDALKRRPIVVRQTRRVCRGSAPPRGRLVEMQMFRMVTSYIRRADNGMVDGTAGRKHRAPIFIGKHADPGPCNNQDSSNDHCSGADSL